MVDLLFEHWIISTIVFFILLSLIGYLIGAIMIALGVPAIIVVIFGVALLL